MNIEQSTQFQEGTSTTFVLPYSKEYIFYSDQHNTGVAIEAEDRAQSFEGSGIECARFIENNGISLEGKNISATVSDAKVLVNGEETSVKGYNVNNTNYFKIRDIAMILRSTSAKFNIEYLSDDNAIDIVPGADYVSNGTELVDDAAGAIEAVENDMPIYVNGRSTAITAYNINGSAYFKIRDIADAVGFEVQWDGDAQSINLVTE